MSDKKYALEKAFQLLKDWEGYSEPSDKLEDLIEVAQGIENFLNDETKEEPRREGPSGQALVTDMQDFIGNHDNTVSYDVRKRW